MSSLEVVSPPLHQGINIGRACRPRRGQQSPPARLVSFVPEGDVVFGKLCCITHCDLHLAKAFANSATMGSPTDGGDYVLGNEGKISARLPNAW